MFHVIFLLLRVNNKALCNIFFFKKTGYKRRMNPIDKFGNQKSIMLDKENNVHNVNPNVQPSIHIQQSKYILGDKCECT